MHKIKIPNTELVLSPIGLGCVNAGLKWNQEKSEYLFDTFLDLGGNVYDTARVYSDWVPPEVGRSERVIGDWLRKTKKREQIVLVTKGGHPDMVCANPDVHSSRMSDKDMRHDLELSLRALETEYIDLYFYHRDDESIPVEMLIDTMEGFVKEGKIRFYGCSNWSTARMKAADAYCKSTGARGFAANQVLFNLGSSSMHPLEDDTLMYMDEGMKAYHKENTNNLAMPYMGIASGFFHNYIEKGEDWVKDSPYYTAENIKLAKRVKLVTEQYNATITQAVLGFFVTGEFPCLPLYGPRNADMLKEAMETFGIPFKKEDYIVQI